MRKSKYYHFVKDIGSANHYYQICTAQKPQFSGPTINLGCRWILGHDTNVRWLAHLGGRGVAKVLLIRKMTGTHTTFEQITMILYE